MGVFHGFLTVQLLQNNTFTLLDLPPRELLGNTHLSDRVYSGCQRYQSIFRL